MKYLKIFFKFLFIELILGLVIVFAKTLYYLLKQLMRVSWLALKYSCIGLINTTYYVTRVLSWPFRNCFPPKNINQMSGLEFEQFCCKWLSLGGYRFIQKTPNSSDYGIDILTVKDDQKIGVQCKRYSGKVGVGAIQEVTAGLSYYELEQGIVITNSDFTPNARELAEANNIELICGEDLNNSKACKTLIKSKGSMYVSTFLMGLLTIIGVILIVETIIVNKSLLPLSIMFFGICLLTMINGILELKDRKRKDTANFPENIKSI